ncbi:hypothetical protein JTE90_024895 [Oedothorax gibbosus]|uniref:SCP domain-containing protein n=1 Tax=Oedothorax gibbosus TaxID=931172 RepID=A0AAV6V297_9ARAC|nr:hypothetical protein JTE90_024895 [Oedothorax gibbosus]
MYLLLVVTAFLCVTHCWGQCSIQVRGVKDAQKRVIVKKHNELRAKVANGKESGLPKAANMLKMEWDEAVARKAQEWANKCRFQHDTAADRDTGNGYVGQNIAYISNQNPEPDWESIIQDFYSEVSQFDKRTVDRYRFEHKTGHFTQIIWANTYKVGCGYVRHQERGNYVHLYGCNYLPGGNIIGSPIYEKGQPCSKCGGCSSIAGLCDPNARSNPTRREDEASLVDEDDNNDRSMVDIEEDFDDLFL